MTELSEVLERLGLLQYLGRLNDEGFENWETVLDITELDLATLDFKLGHRRILQREIASARGIAVTQALTSAQFGTVEDFDQEEKSPLKSFRSDSGKGHGTATIATTTTTTTGKRKYRRHPKSDENAPEKPPSAYVMFANSVRDELKGQNLTFTDIAKLVGERWKVLAPEKKEMYEHEASAAKDKFNSEFEEYKKTDSYREYVKYLADFKSKLVKDGKETTVEEQSELNVKRPKLENNPNSGSAGSLGIGGTIGSIVSGNNVGNLAGIAKSTGSISRPSSAYSSSPSQKMSSPAHSRNFSSSTPLSPPKSSTQTMDFAGYRDALARTTQQQQQQEVLSATDTDNHFLPRIHLTSHIQQQSSYVRHQPTSITAQHINPRNSIIFPSPGIRRLNDETFSPQSVSGSISSSGSSTAPSVASLTPSIVLDDSTRSHRALPFPSPSTSGYFDQRSHHQRQTSQPRSPRSSYGQMPISLPTIDHHSRIYCPPATQQSTLSGITFPSTGLPPPFTPMPPSQNRHE